MKSKKESGKNATAEEAGSIEAVSEESVTADAESEESGVAEDEIEASAAEEPVEKQGEVEQSAAQGLEPEQDTQPNSQQNAGEEEAVDASPELGKDELRLVVESLLFAADKSLSLTEMAKLVGSKVEPIEIKAVVDELIEFYQDRGMVLHKVSGGFQFRTHEKSSFWVQKLIAGKPVRLSRAQVETLAIVAYRQPVTRPDIDEIRGVDSGGTLRVLLERNLVRILGKKEEPGRPLLYGTSSQFLDFFNLSELKDLPTLREFHELTDESVSEAKRRGVDLKGAKSLEEVPSPEAQEQPSEEGELVGQEGAEGEQMMAAEDAAESDSSESVSSEHVSEPLPENTEGEEVEAEVVFEASDEAEGEPQDEPIEAKPEEEVSEDSSGPNADSVVLDDESGDENDSQPVLS